jgi:hypothetical protein
MLQMTRHGACRAQQRSVPPAVLDWLIQFGDEEFLGEGVRRYAFTKRTWKKLSSYLGGLGLAEPEKARSAYAVIAPDDSLITVGYRTGRLKSAW